MSEHSAEGVCPHDGVNFTCEHVRPSMWERIRARVSVWWWRYDCQCHFMMGHCPIKAHCRGTGEDPFPDARPAAEVIAEAQALIARLDGSQDG